MMVRNILLFIYSQANCAEGDKMRGRKLILVLLFLTILSPLFYSKDSVLAQPAQTSDWPMFHHDLANTGFVDSEGPDVPNLAWKYYTDQDIYSSPAVVDGKVFIGCGDHYVYCLNSSDGNLIWRYQTGDHVPSSPAIVDGRLYIGSDDGYLYCLDSSNGNLIWRYKVDDYIYSSPAVDGDRVYFGQGYFGSRDGYLFCINASNGDFIWNYHTGHVAMSPAIANDRVYAGSAEGYLYCLDSSNGNLVWRYDAGDVVFSSPAILDGKVYAGSVYNYSVFCLNASDGSLIWINYAGSYIESSPAVAHGRVYIGSYDHYLYCFNATNGNLIWRYQTEYTITCSPAVTKERVYVGSQDGFVYCLNADNGVLIWNYNTHYILHSSPAIVDNNLYIASYSEGLMGCVYCFEPGDSSPGIDFILNARESLNFSLQINSTQPIHVHVGKTLANIDIPPQFEVLGSTFVISANISSGFTVTIYYYYTDEQLAALGFDESTLAIYYKNEATNQWIELPTTVDTINNVLVAEVDHLTIFGVFGEAQQNGNPGEQNEGTVLMFPILGFVMIIAAVGFIIAVKSKAKASVVEPLIEPLIEPKYNEETTREEIVEETEKAGPLEHTLPSEAICAYCGYVNPSDAEFCIRCGRHLV